MDEALKKHILGLLVDKAFVYPADLYPAVLERHKAKGQTVSLDDVKNMLEELVKEGLVEKIDEDKYKITDKGKSLVE